MLGVLVAHWGAGTPAGETAALESMWQEWQHHSFSQSSEAWPSWGCGAEAGSLQAMGRLAGLEDLVSSPPGFPWGSPLKTRWVSRGLERRQDLFSRESLGSGRNQEGSALRASGAGFLLGSASHPINMSTRGQEKGYFGLGSKMKKTFLSTLPFSNPQHAPPQKRKKFCYRGKKVLFSFTMKKSTGCSPKLQIYFSNSKYLY